MAYASKCLDVHEKNYQISEKELFAIVIACRKFRHYLSGKKFVVVADHAALQFLNNLKELQGRLGRWALLLQESNYTVFYRKGKLHQDADSLSRHQSEAVTLNEYDCEIPVYSCFVPLVNDTAQLIYE